MGHIAKQCYVNSSAVKFRSYSKWKHSTFPVHRVEEKRLDEVEDDEKIWVMEMDQPLDLVPPKFDEF